MRDCKSRAAFTLAEVLITLGIIGVVAAMTIPNLISKHSKQATVTKLKKVYSTLSQVMIRSTDDVGTLSNFISLNSGVDAEAVEEYYKTAWFPYFSGVTLISNDYGKFYPKKVTLLNGSVDQIDYGTNYGLAAAFFSTNDGILYHPRFMYYEVIKDENGDVTSYIPRFDRMTVMVDIDGVKGKNTYGKDVFTFCINFETNEVVPGCTKDRTEANNDCRKNGVGNTCAAKIKNDGWTIADDYPW